MKPLILIVGPSGAGKSMTFQDLDWPTSRYADLERKGVPFESPSAPIWSPTSIEPVAFIKSFQDWLTAVTKDPTVKVIVIDSISKLFEYLELKANIDSKGDGFLAWRLFAQYTLSFLEQFKQPGITVFCTGHDETITSQGLDGKLAVQRRCKVNGKVWEGKIEKEFLIVMYAGAKVTGTGVAHYLSTKTDGTNSAKCPPRYKIPAEIPNSSKTILGYLNSVTT